MTVDVSVVAVVGVVLPRLNKVIVPGVEVVTVLGAPEGSMRVTGVEVVTILSPNPP